MIGTISPSTHAACGQANQLFNSSDLTEKMTKFRPCIDLHSGQVKQIVGGTLSQVAADLKTNYVSKLPASHYAGLYQKHDLRGGHVVKLGPGNEEAAQEACKTWPGGLQVAGGITDKNAKYWIDQGADKVRLVTALWRWSILHLAIARLALLSGFACSCLFVLRHSRPDANHGMRATGDHHIIPLPRGQVLPRTSPVSSVCS